MIARLNRAKIANVKKTLTYPYLPEVITLTNDQGNEQPAPGEHGKGERQVLNQEMRTITMSRSDMCRIKVAITTVMLSFKEGSSSRKMWERIRSDLISQLQAQDLRDKQ